MTAYVAQLRVYEPLAAFSDRERRRWEAYAACGTAPAREQGPLLEHEAGLRALVGRAPALLPELPEHAYVTRVDGVTLVCPWRTRLRAEEALLDFRSGLPDELADAFLPPAVAQLAQEQLDRDVREHPDRRAHVLNSSWQVPLRWFVLVDPVERSVSRGAPGSAPGVPSGAASRTGGPPPGGPLTTGRWLVYRTPMSQARRRLARALSVLRGALDEGPVTAGVAELGRWLEEFHPQSLVELDYGGLVHLLDDAELSADESARDIARALAALAEGRGEQAGAAYARATARMKALQAVESAS